MLASEVGPALREVTDISTCALGFDLPAGIPGENQLRLEKKIQWVQNFNDQLCLHPQQYRTTGHAKSGSLNK